MFRLVQSPRLVQFVRYLKYAYLTVVGDREL